MADASNISPTPFDGATVWATLSPEEQARIGAVALELAVAGAIAEYLPGPAERAGAEAQRLALKALESAALNADGIDRKWVDVVGGKPRIRIPSLVGRVCLTCGCSQEDPCEEGCGWHDAMTCTACAGSGEAAHG
ncbi:MULTISPECIES: hypothetical protein [Methylobacterium]|uniref:hypothetical protein n=1 Tax=Methylobacterium TaxID=407 RepID=UPI00272DD839|nr:hypothetical protein [Methylobacterium sp.]